MVLLYIVWFLGVAAAGVEEGVLLPELNKDRCCSNPSPSPAWSCGVLLLADLRILRGLCPPSCSLRQFRRARDMGFHPSVPVAAAPLLPPVAVRDSEVCGWRLASGFCSGVEVRWCAIPVAPLMEVESGEEKCGVCPRPASHKAFDAFASSPEVHACNNGCDGSSSSQGLAPASCFGGGEAVRRKIWIDQLQRPTWFFFCVGVVHVKGVRQVEIRSLLELCNLYPIL